MADNTVKFTWIVFCFILTAFSFFRCVSKRDWVFLMAGMAFTLVSDFFLVLYDNQIPGLCCFCFVHMFYFLRAAAKWRAVPLITAVCASPLFFFLDVLIGVTVLYALLFMEEIVANAVNLRRGRSKTPAVNRWVTLIGVLLFALCDINVLFYNAPRYVNAPERLSSMGYAFIWVFYAPAQLLLALSAVRYERKSTGTHRGVFKV